MVGGVNEVIVRSDGEIVDALGAAKSNLAASVGITGGGSPKVAGQVPLHCGDGVSVSRESDGQVIAYVIGNSAYDSTGIREGPDLRGHSGFVLRGENQTAFVREPNKIMHQAPMPAGHRFLSTGGDVHLNHGARQTVWLAGIGDVRDDELSAGRPTQNVEEAVLEGGWVCGKFASASTVGFGDHQCDFIGGKVQRGIGHAGAIRGESNRAVGRVQQAARGATEDGNLIQLGGCLAVGTDGVFEEIAVRSECEVAYCTVAWRDNLYGAVYGDLANPETELTVLIRNIREVAGVG